MEYVVNILDYIDKDKAKSWADNNQQTIDDARERYKELRETYGEAAGLTNLD